MKKTALSALVLSLSFVALSSQATTCSTRIENKSDAQWVVKYVVNQGGMAYLGSCAGSTTNCALAPHSVQAISYSDAKWYKQEEEGQVWLTDSKGVSKKFGYIRWWGSMFGSCPFFGEVTKQISLPFLPIRLTYHKYGDMGPVKLNQPDGNGSILIERSSW